MNQFQIKICNKGLLQYTGNYYHINKLRKQYKGGVGVNIYIAIRWINTILLFHFLKSLITIFVNRKYV